MGGFAGSETNRAQRNPATRPTILDGGGIACWCYNEPVIANNTIVGNNAPPTFLGHLGGGIAPTLNTNGIVVANNIVVSNSSGIYHYPYTSYQPVLLHNCVNNSNANYINLSAGARDLQTDPQFVSRAAGNFRLLATSPCIDAGTNLFAAALDFDGVGRPLDGNADGIARWDLGAFEFEHPTANTDGDGMKDMAEVTAGTDPTDPASVLRLGIRWLSLDGAVVLSWPAVAGRTHTLQWRHVLAATNDWQVLTGNLASVGGLLEHRPSVTGAASGFYRLSVQRN